MKKLLTICFLSVSAFADSRQNTFYLGPYISYGVSIPTGNKYYNEAFKSCMAPSAGLILEWQRPADVGFQSGLIWVDRSSRYEGFADYGFNTYPFRIKTFYHTFYLAIPVLASYHFNYFYITGGIDLNFPVFNYTINKEPLENKDFNSGNSFSYLLFSGVLKTGIQVPLKNNKLFFELQFDKDILDTRSDNNYAASRLNMSIACGYLFNIDKPEAKPVIK